MKGRYWSDLCTSVTPVLGAKSGGEIMKNSPRYAAWWAISRLSTFSESRRDKINQQNQSKQIIYGSIDADGRLPSEKNCPDIGRTLGSLGTVQACYSYTDESGEELFQVLRFTPKSFRQRHKGADGSWIWRNDIRTALFRLPLLKEGVEKGSSIWITEGEEDAIELLRHGLIATTVPGGASEPGQRPKWLQEHTELIRGTESVTIWADNDQAGLAHALAIVAHIRDAIRSEPQVVISNLGNDAKEHFANGGTINDLEVIYGANTKIDHHPQQEELDLTVSRFLHANPEFVPRAHIVRQKLLMVYDSKDWEKELEKLV